MNQLAWALLVVMFGGAVCIALWTRPLYKKFAATPRVQWHAGRGCLHPIGCFVFMAIPLPLVAIAPPLALCIGLAFLALAVNEIIGPGRTNLEITGVLCLCSLVWLAYWGYESQLFVWKQTIKGAPIRVDLLIAAPVLYFVSVVGLTLGLAQRPPVQSGGGADDSRTSSGP